MRDGGPAFPWVEFGRCRDCQSWDVEPAPSHQSGMTLRDYFAAAVLASEITDYVNAGSLAKRAYEVADAMLAAREATHGD